MNAACGAKRRPGEQDAGRWAEALEEASTGIREVVERTYKQWNTILRDYLRSEMALRLTVGTDAQSVPVRVVGGMPLPFAEVMRRLEGLEWLLLNRPALVAASTGTQFMAEHADAMRQVWGTEVGASGHDEIARVQKTAEAWLKKQAFDQAARAFERAEEFGRRVVK